MDTIAMVGIIFVSTVLLTGGLLFFFWFLVGRKNDTATDVQRAGTEILQRELQDLRRLFDDKLGESSRDMQASMRSQLGESAKIVGAVTEKLTRLEETNRQVMGYAESLERLQDVLTNPKQRGVLGEYYLESVLQNVLPPGGFQMQYAFDNGEAVDAVVFVKEKIIPIDSKFSLENYNRMLEVSDGEEKKRFEKLFINDLKTRIQETSKYIRPSEGTTEFAFMFIPAEGIYYDLLTNKIGSAEDSLIQVAASKYKVVIVSPTSFLAYLQTVLQGLKAMQIEESAKEIRKRVEDLGRHIKKYDEYYHKLGTSLITTVNHYNAGYKELGKIDKDVLKITGDSGGVDMLVIDKPAREE